MSVSGALELSLSIAQLLMLTTEKSPKCQTFSSRCQITTRTWLDDAGDAVVRV